MSSTWCSCRHQYIEQSLRLVGNELWDFKNETEFCITGIAIPKFHKIYHKILIFGSLQTDTNINSNATKRKLCD